MLSITYFLYPSYNNVLDVSNSKLLKSLSGINFLCSHFSRPIFVFCLHVKKQVCKIRLQKISKYIRLKRVKESDSTWTVKPDYSRKDLAA